MDTASNPIVGILVFLLSIAFLIGCVILYFVPALIAARRQHPHTWLIFFVNLVTGWSLIGWLICLFWAFGFDPRQNREQQQQQQTIVVQTAPPNQTADPVVSQQQQPTPEPKAFRVRCPGCTQTLRAPIEMAGKTALCPKCQTHVAVPEVERWT